MTFGEYIGPSTPSTPVIYFYVRIFSLKIIFNKKKKFSWLKIKITVVLYFKITFLSPNDTVRKITQVPSSNKNQVNSVKSIEYK